MVNKDTKVIYEVPVVGTIRVESSNELEAMTTASMLLPDTSREDGIVIGIGVPERMED